MIVTQHVTVCPNFLGADNVPYLLAIEAMMVILRHTDCPTVGVKCFCC